MDYDYHSSFQRLVLAYKEAEREIGEAVMHSVDLMVENTKSLSFENDLHYFLQDYPQPFTPPNPFHFVPFDTDDVAEYKVNTQDVFKRAQKTVNDLHEEIQTLEIQREEDVKTIQHMQQVNLRKYQVTTDTVELMVLAWSYCSQEQVWYFISKTSRAFEHSDPTQEFSWQPFSVG